MKIALVGPTDRSIWGARYGLMQALLSRGDKVYVLCAPGEYVERIKSLGVNYIPIELYRFMDPRQDLKYLFRLVKIFRREKFDLIHNFSIKPNVYGSIAARLAGTRRVFALIEGLGFGYKEGPGMKAWLSRQLVLGLYRICCMLTTRVWFINRDDLNLFLKSKVINERKAVFIRSIGIDADKYSMDAVSGTSLAELRKEFNDSGSTLYVTMVARMVWSKGVREFVEAAKLLQAQHADTKFLLVGDVEPGSPLAISNEYLTRGVSDNVIWLGFRRDARELTALSDVVVLPSYYREGVPLTLLEGMSLGKPVVTTDSVGCREVVEEGRNGYLVPTRDPHALAEAIGRLLNDPVLRAEMGASGRSWVEREFNEKLIVARVIKELYRLENSQ